jgi:IPT/TIG domain-containing protein
MLKATNRKFKTAALIVVCLSLVAFPNVQRLSATTNDNHVAAGLAKSAVYAAIMPQNGGCPPLGFDADAPNLLRNASFEETGPRGASASIFRRDGAVDTRSAAADWTMHTSNDRAQVTTEVIKSNRILGGPSMLHITAGSNEGGVYQLFERDDHGPTLVVASVWVYVRRGRVVLATGNEGVTPTHALNGTFGSWEKLTACSDGSTTNNWFVIYSTAVEGSDFYVDQAKVSRVKQVPNPNRCGGMLIEKIVPNVTFPGGVIAINGRGFGNRQGTKLPAINRNNRLNLLQVTKWTDTQILAKSPLDLVGGTYVVLIYCDGSYRTSSNSLEVTVRDDLHRPR